MPTKATTLATEKRILIDLRGNLDGYYATELSDEKNDCIKREQDI